MKPVKFYRIKEFLPHILVAVTIAVVCSLRAASPGAYEAAMQEDRFVEWLTFILFLVAGCVGVYRGARALRAFDFLVGVFCLFVAGEEISWGQRLFGFVPPEVFLRSNYQQEVNVHNMAAMFGQPKWTLIGVLLAFGVLLPAAFRISALKPLYKTLGATPPAERNIPLFALLALVLYWYPIPYTGEWVEMLSGSLFLFSLAEGVQAWAMLGAAIPVAIGFSVLSSNGRSDEESITCTQRETRALVDALVHDRALHPPVSSNFERRVWTALSEGVIVGNRLGRFYSARCGSEGIRREEFAIDPWGTSYWLQVIRKGDVITVTVYSFGPNRRRDEIVRAGDKSDDIAAHDILPRYTGPIILP